MAIRTLLLALQAISEQNIGQLRSDSVLGINQDPLSVAPFVDEAEVQDVDSLSGVSVKLKNGNIVTCSMATDEPLDAGMKVYVSLSSSGFYVVHGSVKS